MTSKEVVEEIKKIVSTFGLNQASLSIKRRSKDEWITIAKIEKVDLEQIEKDLEVLDILKPKIELMTIEKNHYLKLLNCDGKMIPLTQDEYNKLKE